MRSGEELESHAADEQHSDQHTDPDDLTASHRALGARYFVAIDVRGDRLWSEGRKRDGALLADPNLMALASPTTNTCSAVELIENIRIVLTTSRSSTVIRSRPVN